MGELQEPQPQQATTKEPIDLRTELNRALAEEFKAALVSQTALTGAQRTRLTDALESGQVSSTSLLKIFANDEG